MCDRCAAPEYNQCDSGQVRLLTPALSYCWYYVIVNRVIYALWSVLLNKAVILRKQEPNPFLCQPLCECSTRPQRSEAFMSRQVAVVLDV